MPRENTKIWLPAKFGRPPTTEEFLRLIPPFVHVETVPRESAEYAALPSNFVMMGADSGLHANALTYAKHGFNRGWQEATTQLSEAPTRADGPVRLADLKVMMTEVMVNLRAEGDHYVEGIDTWYLIHSDNRTRMIDSLLGDLLVSERYDGVTRERLISVSLDGQALAFTITPYAVEDPRRIAEDSGWLILFAHNPRDPGLVLRVAEGGPFEFKEPTPLLSESEVAERWAMKVLKGHLEAVGRDTRDTSREPNGEATFPDYHAKIDGLQWDIEVTRVMGAVPENRRVLDRPYNAKRHWELVTGAPPLLPRDTQDAVDRAITSKLKTRHTCCGPQRVCLVLLNVLRLDVRAQSDLWQREDVSRFGAVVLIEGFSTPKVEVIHGGL